MHSFDVGLKIVRTLEDMLSFWAARHEASTVLVLWAIAFGLDPVFGMLMAFKVIQCRKTLLIVTATDITFKWSGVLLLVFSESSQPLRFHPMGSWTYLYSESHLPVHLQSSQLHCKFRGSLSTELSQVGRGTD